MRLIALTILGLLMLPLAELIAFLLMAAALGFVAAFALLIATSLGGLLLLRRAGRARLGSPAADTAPFSLAALRRLDLAAAGFLLLLPGFITDVAGLLLLVPGFRRRLRATIGRAPARPRHRTVAVVDLGPGEWRQVDVEDPPPQSPRSR